jgi:hypothetical protein
MCSPAVIPWVLGAVGIGVVKHQSDMAKKGMQNAMNDAAARTAAIGAPKPVAPPAAIISGEPLKDVNAQTAAARADAQRKAKALAGIGGTLKTGGLGVPGPAPVQGKTLLGQ